MQVRSPHLPFDGILFSRNVQQHRARRAV